MQVSTDNSTEARERGTPLRKREFSTFERRVASRRARNSFACEAIREAMRYLVIACTGFCSLETRREVPPEIRGHSCLNKMEKRSRRRERERGSKEEERQSEMNERMNEW